MSYLRYMCLFAHSGIQHILCCVFVLIFFVLCTLYCQFLWFVLFLLPLRYSPMFIYYPVILQNTTTHSPKSSLALEVKLKELKGCFQLTNTLYICLLHTQGFNVAKMVQKTNVGENRMSAIKSGQSNLVVCLSDGV